MILATCGANAGDATTTSAVAPSATISPSASTIDPIRDRGDELDVVGGDHDRAAGCRELAHDARSGVPWRRSRGRASARRAAPRSVSRRAGSRARARAVALPRGRAGAASSGTPGTTRSSSARVLPGRGAGLAVGLRALERDRRVVQQVARRLRDERDAAAPRRRRQLPRDPSRRRSTVPLGARAGTLERPQQRRLARTVATHARDDFAGEQVEVDRADARRHRRTARRAGAR